MAWNWNRGHGQLHNFFKVSQHPCANHLLPSPTYPRRIWPSPGLSVTSCLPPMHSHCHALCAPTVTPYMPTLLHATCPHCCMPHAPTVTCHMPIAATITPHVPPPLCPICPYCHIHHAPTAAFPLHPTHPPPCHLPP